MASPVVDAVSFSDDVFAVFHIPGFQERMQALRTIVRPRLISVGEALAPDVTALAGHPMYPHVAAHMRRRVNPPDDTWVAWSRSARAYKAYAHFEVGVSADGVFVRFVIKPEGQQEKRPLLETLSPSRLSELQGPHTVFWYRDDHGVGPVAVETITEADWKTLRERAQKARNSIAVGSALSYSNPVVHGERLYPTLRQMLEQLAPLYHWTVSGTP